MLYYYPNKPILITIDSKLIAEKSADPNSVAEIKKNGTRLCLWQSKEEALKHHNYNNFIFWNSHKSVLKYQPCAELLDELRSLNLPNNTHLDAELLHFKTTDIKHQIYFYDLYWYNGQQCFQEFRARRDILGNILAKQNFKHLELATQYKGEYKKLFDKVIVKKENEGLVIKDELGKIVWNLKTLVEVNWQLKVRKPSSNYSV